MFRLSLLPREKKFFALFEQSAHNAGRMAHQFRDMLFVWENVRERVGVITDLEHDGDAIAHQIMAQLRLTYITPFDRDDIAELANSLDDISDFIHSAADAVLLYKIDQPTGKAKELAEILVKSVAEVEQAVLEMHDSIQRERLLSRCVEINRLENMADGVYRSAMAGLFAGQEDYVSLIKWREIYRHVETATDRCEDVADILEGIALKYT